MSHVEFRIGKKITPNPDRPPASRSRVFRSAASASGLRVSAGAYRRAGLAGQRHQRHVAGPCTGHRSCYPRTYTTRTPHTFIAWGPARLATRHATSHSPLKIAGHRGALPRAAIARPVLTADSRLPVQYDRVCAVAYSSPELEALPFCCLSPWPLHTAHRHTDTPSTYHADEYRSLAFHPWSTSHPPAPALTASELPPRRPWPPPPLALPSSRVTRAAAAAACRRRRDCRAIRPWPPPPARWMWRPPSPPPPPP